MSFREEQERAAKLLGNFRTQRETDDWGAPDDDWAGVMALQLFALAFAMVPEHRPAANKVAQEFCRATGLDPDISEAAVAWEVVE